MDWEEGEESGNFDGNATKVAMFGAFHKEMAESLHAAGKLSTAAVVFDWYPNGSRAASQWEDQANSMTYYDPVTSMSGLISNQIGSVAKTKVGVGFGWGTDNEITDPNDILAKCRWAIDNGYGGVMAWDICRAASITSWILDSMSRYVTHNQTFAQSSYNFQYFQNGNMLVKNNRATGINEIFYSVPSGTKLPFIDLGLYDLKGALIKKLVHGQSTEAGLFSIPLPTGSAGTYLLKLSTDSRVQTAKTIISK